MAFSNVTFPDLKLIHGISKSRGDNTIVFGNGFNEYRIRRSPIDPYTWSFPARDLYVDDARELIEFYNNVDGGLYSFKFKDPDDYSWDLFQLTYYKDDKWKVKSNTGSPISYGSISNVYLNGSPQGTHPIILTDDEPYIQVSGSTSGNTVQITGDFVYVARFASALQYSMNALDVNNDTLAVGIGSFELKEVAEHA